MPNLYSAQCYFCATKIHTPDHMAIDEEGQIVCMCDACYQLARKFFVKERKLDANLRRNNESDKQTI